MTTCVYISHLIVKLTNVNRSYLRFVLAPKRQLTKLPSPPPKSKHFPVSLKDVLSITSKSLAIINADSGLSQLYSKIFLLSLAWSSELIS